MIKNDFGKLYVGISDNPATRLKNHNQNRGAFFTKNKTNFHIVFLEEHPNLAEARKRESQIKKWRRDKKEFLVNLYKKKIPTKL